MLLARNQTVGEGVGEGVAEENVHAHMPKLYRDNSPHKCHRKGLFPPHLVGVFLLLLS